MIIVETPDFSPGVGRSKGRKEKNVTLLNSVERAGIVDISNTCAVLAMTSQNVCCGKRPATSIQSPNTKLKSRDGCLPALVTTFTCFTLTLTCSLQLKVIRQQFVLPVTEGEGQKCQEKGVQDANNGQDVGPAHCAVPQAVLIRPLATHPLHLWRVPAVRVDHAAHHHQHGCGGRRTEMLEPCNNYPLGALTLINNYQGGSSEPPVQDKT